MLPQLRSCKLDRITCQHVCLISKWEFKKKKIKIKKWKTIRFDYLHCQVRSDGIRHLTAKGCSLSVAGLFRLPDWVLHVEVTITSHVISEFLLFPLPDCQLVFGVISQLPLGLFKRIFAITVVMEAMQRLTAPFVRASWMVSLSEYVSPQKTSHWNK